MGLPQAPTLRLWPGKSLVLGGLFRLDYVNDNPEDAVLVTWFGQLVPHVTATDKVDDLFQRHAADAASPLLNPYLGPLNSSFAFTLRDTIRRGDGGEDGGDGDGASNSHARGGARTGLRRLRRRRQGVLDVVLSGLGWVCVTPVPVQGMRAWDRTIDGAEFSGFAYGGVDVQLRLPLLPYETVGTKPKDWAMK